jgi:hypothetical protein
MPYMRVDVGFPGHEKAVRAGGDAIWMWLAMKSYAKQNQTDGFVPGCMIGRLQGPDPTKQKRLVKRLIEARLVDAKGNDFEIHDYLDWEESAEHAKARQASGRQRKADWEQRQRERRERERNSVTNGVTGRESNAVTDHVTNAVRNGVSNGVSNATKPNQTRDLPVDSQPKDLSGSARVVGDERAGVPCPKDLELDERHLATLEQTPGIPRPEARFIAAELVSKWSEDHQRRYPSVVRWSQALLTAVRTEWSDHAKRRRAIDAVKPMAEAPWSQAAQDIPPELVG